MLSSILSFLFRLFVPQKRLAMFGCIGLAAVGASVIAVSPAAATWGSHCSQGNGHHCYAIDDWLMNDPPESVEASLAYIDTTSVNVPGWASFAFVDHEMWVDFQGYNSWVETGQTAGNGRDCCTMFPFYAEQLNGAYSEFISPQGIASNNPNLYQIVASGGGVWCVKWSEATARCYSGFPTYSDHLQVGLEAATESTPANHGWDQAYSMYLGGSIHYWEGSQTHAAIYQQPPGTCASARPPGYGSINFGTC
jgi:hypothetical protein